MAGRGQGFCRDCGTPIRWATTTNGKRIALMESPDPDGRYLYIGRGLVKHLHDWEIERHRIAVTTRETTAKLWLPHAAECPATKPDPVVSDDVIARALATVRKDKK